MRYFIAALLVCCGPTFAQSLFTLDVLPGDDAPKVLPVESWSELVSHLDGALNARVVLRVQPGRQLLDTALRGSTQPHFVLADGVLALPDEDYAILQVSQERLTAVLLVWDNSPLQKVADLNGKSVLANPGHAVAVLGQRLMRRQGVEFAVGGGRHHNEAELLAHFAQFGGRDALLTSSHAAKRLMAQHPGRFRLLPETESAPRWVLAGRRSLPPAVHAGFLVALREAPFDLSPDARRLLPASWSPREAGTPLFTGTFAPR